MAEFPADLHAEIEKYERKHAENPDGRYFLPLANTYRKLGQLERAEELLRAGLKRHPDYLSAHIVLGRTLADRGAAAEATAEFQHVLAVDPQNLIALRTLGELGVSEGRLDDAAHWYRELLAVDPMNDEARQALAGIEAPPVADEVDDAGQQVDAEREDEQFGATHTDGVAMAAASVEDLRGTAETEQMPEDGGADGEERALPAWVESIDPFLGDSDADPAEDLMALLEPTAATDEEARPGADPFAGEPTVEADDFELVTPDAAEAADLPELPAFGEPPTDVAHAEQWDAPLGDEPEDLASETLAELYAGQGFTQQAADMYRQLIRRRGAEPALLLRLAELEAEAVGAGEAGQPAAEGTAMLEAADAALEEPPADLEPLETPEPAATADTALGDTGAEPLVAELETRPGETDGFDEAQYPDGAVERETAEPAALEEALEIELAPVEAELQPGVEDASIEEPPSELVAGPAEPAGEQDLEAEDSLEDFHTVGSELDLAEAWEEVFPEEDAAGVEDAPTTAAAVELLRVEPRQEAVPFAESFRFGFTGAAASEAILDAEVIYPAAATDGSADAEPADSDTDQGAGTAPAVLTIGEYFSALLAWAPARRESPEHPASPPIASGAPPEAGSGTTKREPSEAGSEAGRAAEVASAEQELFPWELARPRESGPSHAAREEQEAPPGRADTLRDAGDEAPFAAREDTPAEPDSHLEQREEPSPFASPDAQEDDDLESFQAWLRSLKR